MYLMSIVVPLKTLIDPNVDRVITYPVGTLEKAFVSIVGDVSP